MAIVSSKSFTNAPKKRGPLVRVEIGPGRYVKMYREDAIAAGHIPAHGPSTSPSTSSGRSKSHPPAEDKMRLAGEDKALPAPQRGEQGTELGTPGAAAAPPAGPKPDDFTTIPGVGPATARALQARGITTFEQLNRAALRQAQGAAQDGGVLEFLNPQARAAIERWREGNGPG